MSKASEYVDKVKEATVAEPEDFYWKESESEYSPYGRVSVTKGGWLWSSHCLLPPAEALKLADWIYSTFRD